MGVFIRMELAHFKPFYLLLRSITGRYQYKRGFTKNCAERRSDSYTQLFIYNSRSEKNPLPIALLPPYNATRQRRSAVNL